MQSKLIVLMQHYGLEKPKDLYAVIEREYPDSTLTSDLLGKLHRNTLREIRRSALIEICQIFGLQRVSQLIDFDWATTEDPTSFREFWAASLHLESKLPERLAGSTQTDLSTRTGVSTSTVGRWHNDFAGVEKFRLEAVEKLGEGLSLTTIDELIGLYAEGATPRRTLKGLYKEKSKEGGRFTQLPVSKETAQPSLVARIA